MVDEALFSHNMEESATADDANNNGKDDCDAVAVAVRNTPVVEVPIPPLLLTVLMPYVVEPPDTRA